MDCPKCAAPVLVERIDAKCKRVRCAKCGFNEVLDDRDLPLLTEVPSYSPERALNS